jgi:DNA-binding PadR family transcriptional regulator
MNSPATGKRQSSTVFWGARPSRLKPSASRRRILKFGQFSANPDANPKGIDYFISALDIHSNDMYCSAMLSKELVAASTEPVILSLLSGGESYGYALIQEVKRLSGDKIEWTDGMIYPVLHRMENEGWIASRWGQAENGRKRKYYSLKKDGKKALERQREQWVTVSGVFKQLWKEQYV